MTGSWLQAEKWVVPVGSDRISLAGKEMGHRGDGRQCGIGDRRGDGRQHRVGSSKAEETGGIEAARRRWQCEIDGRKGDGRQRRNDGF
ncbi:hypothetical protein ACLOJK_002018 [Asimina triloba]